MRARHVLGLVVVVLLGLQASPRFQLVMLVAVFWIGLRAWCALGSLRRHRLLLLGIGFAVLGAAFVAWQWESFNLAGRFVNINPYGVTAQTLMYAGWIFVGTGAVLPALAILPLFAVANNLLAGKLAYPALAIVAVVAAADIAYLALGHDAVVPVWLSRTGLLLLLGLAVLLRRDMLIGVFGGLLLCFVALFFLNIVLHMASYTRSTTYMIYAYILVAMLSGGGYDPVGHWRRWLGRTGPSLRTGFLLLCLTAILLPAAGIVQGLRAHGFAMRVNAVNCRGWSRLIQAARQAPALEFATDPERRWNPRTTMRAVLAEYVGENHARVLETDEKGFVPFFTWYDNPYIHVEDQPGSTVYVELASVVKAIPGTPAFAERLNADGTLPAAWFADADRHLFFYVFGIGSPPAAMRLVNEAGEASAPTGKGRADGYWVYTFRLAPHERNADWHVEVDTAAPVYVLRKTNDLPLTRMEKERWYHRFVFFTCPR